MRTISYMPDWFYNFFCSYSYDVEFNMVGDNPPPNGIKVSKILLFVWLSGVNSIASSLYVHVHQSEKKEVKRSLVNLALRKLPLKRRHRVAPQPLVCNRMQSSLPLKNGRQRETVLYCPLSCNMNNLHHKSKSIRLLHITLE